MMNKLMFVLVFIFSWQVSYAQTEFLMPTLADYPEIAKTGAKTADFIPANWKILSEAKGDLNGDKIADAVLAVKGLNPKFVNKNDGLGTDEFDTNPRILIVLFGTKDGFKLAEQNNNIIAIASSPTMEEPFDSAAIKDGKFYIEQHIFMSAGGWGTSKYIYTFRFQNGEFALIGADTTSVQRNTGEMETRSYNFLTRKVKVSKGSIENDKEKVTTRSFNIAKLQTLKAFPKAFEWEIEKDFYI